MLLTWLNYLPHYRAVTTGNISGIRPLLIRIISVIAMVMVSLLYSFSHALLQLLVVLSWRLSLLHGQLPHFLEEDNPASFSPHLTTRIMTYSYLCVVNSWLLIAPVSLCYDWQMGSVPLIESPYDIRNMATLILFLTMAVIAWLLAYGKLPVSLLQQWTIIEVLPQQSGWLIVY